MHNFIKKSSINKEDLGLFIFAYGGGSPQTGFSVFAENTCRVGLFVCAHPFFFFTERTRGVLKRDSLWDWLVMLCQYYSTNLGLESIREA